MAEETRNEAAEPRAGTRMARWGLTVIVTAAMAGGFALGRVTAPGNHTANPEKSGSPTAGQQDGTSNQGGGGSSR